MTAGRAHAAWFAFLGHLAKKIAAAMSLARAAAHKFVLSPSSGEVVWCSILVLHGHVLGLQSLVMRLLTSVNMQIVLVGDIFSAVLAFWLAFVGLVTTTHCHERKGSRFAFAEVKATPRVDVAEAPDICEEKMELEKPVCRSPVFVRTFSGTRTLYPAPLISDFTLLVSQSTAMPETSFHLTFQKTLLQGGHTVGQVGVGRDASLAARG